MIMVIPCCEPPFRMGREKLHDSRPEPPVTVPFTPFAERRRIVQCNEPPDPPRMKLQLPAQLLVNVERVDKEQVGRFDLDLERVCLMVSQLRPAPDLEHVVKLGQPLQVVADQRPRLGTEQGRRRDAMATPHLRHVLTLRGQ